MSFPTRPDGHFRLSPADGITLSRENYELRGADGKLLFTVSRDRAERGISAGDLELWNGPHGAYLRASIRLPYPSAERRQSESAPRTSLAPKGAVRPVVHTSKNAACGQVGSCRSRQVGSRL